MRTRMRDLQAARQRPDRPGEAADRARRAEAGRLAWDDVQVRMNRRAWSCDLVEEMIPFQEERLAFHLAQLEARDRVR